MSKKVTFLKGPNRRSKIFFLNFFKKMRVLRVLKRSCAKFAPFWMKKKYLRTPRKSVKRAKNHFFKGSKEDFKIIFLKFFLYGGVFGTHKKGCAKFAPFWMKIINIGTSNVNDTKTEVQTFRYRS